MSDMQEVIQGKNLFPEVLFTVLSIGSMGKEQIGTSQVKHALPFLTLETMTTDHMTPSKKGEPKNVVRTVKFIGPKKRKKREN